MQTTMDLSGLWEVRLGDGAPATVHLPGTLEENGLGEPETPALESRLTRRFRWEGEAVFSREVTLPDHPGRRLILEAERARQLRLTVDGQPVPTLQGTLSTPYLFELTRWAGRRVRLCLLSDNRYPGWPREEIVHASAATDETQTNWNGLLGRLCVHSVADFWVRSVRVYPHGRTLDAAVDLAVPRQALDAVGDGELVLEGPALARPFCLLRRDWQPESLRQGLCTLWCRDLPVAPEAPLWEEACGALTQITASLVLDGRTVSRARADFGLRTFGADGGRLTLNGRVFLLRGEANCCVFPETGHPPMTTGAWREVLGRYRAYGVNCLRFHSWCPPEAAFAAADELGMLLQPELSDWNCTNALETPHSAAYYEAELRQILFCYANHPSFVMLTLGNELCTGEEGHRRMAELVRLARQLDPTRRYAGSSNGQYGEQGYDGVSDFYTAAAYGDRMLRATSSPMIGHLNRCRPGTRQNYREAAAQTGGVPVFGFEVGQYESWPDFDQIDRFRGITIPENLRAIRRRAEQTGAAAYWQAGVQASGELALRCYREEVEAVLRTPGMSGLSLLGLQDFPGQGTALVGMMDAHLAPKPADFARPERFAAFFAPVVLLACFDRYTYEAGEWFTADLRVANYGRQTLAGPLCWRIAEGRTILGQGTLDAPAGWPAGGGPYPVADARRCASPCPDARTVRRGPQQPLSAVELSLRQGRTRRAAPPDRGRPAADRGGGQCPDRPARRRHGMPGVGALPVQHRFLVGGHLPGAGRHDGAADPGGTPGPQGLSDRDRFKLAVVDPVPRPGFPAAPHDRAGRPGAGQRDPAGQPGPAVGGPARERPAARQRHGPCGAP